MALGAKLIAATLILGASTVGTYAIANGGLGGLSSEGDSSASTDTQGTQEAVSEGGSASTGETGVRSGPESSVAVTPQAQSQPVPTGGPSKEDGATVSNPVVQAEREEKGEEQVERAKGSDDTAVNLPGAAPEAAPQERSPAPSLPERGSEDPVGPKEGVQGQDPAVVPNVEAEVASDTAHSSEEVTPQQQSSEVQSSDLGNTSNDAGPAAGENQHTITATDGGAQSNPTTKQENNGSDPSKGHQAEIAQAPESTDPNTGGSGKAGTEQQDKGASSDQLDVTQIEAGDSHTPPNQADNGQNEATLGTQDDHNTEEN